MSIIKKSKLREFGKTSRYFGKSVSDSLNEHKQKSKYGKTKIFLSHKHDENEELDDAIAFLKKFSIDIYVDWLDEEMPEHTNGETAVRIKTKIKENDKFILLATEAAIESKWCNWELGYGDAEKYIDHIVVLPVENDGTNYSGAEYLNIYPYIVEANSYPGFYYIQYPDGSTKTIETWLKNK